MDSSFGVLLFQFFHVFTVFFLLISSVYADNSPTVQIGQHCFTPISRCGVSLDYPMELLQESSDSCGYPGFEINCGSLYNGTPFMNFNNHVYRVVNMLAGYSKIQIVDMEVDGQDCPQPKKNFSLPSSPSWVHYYLPDDLSVRIFYNCSNDLIDAKQHHLCSEDHDNTTNTPPSYAFYMEEIPKEFDWYGKCAENVVVPVLVNKQNGLNYNDAIRLGFYMGWSATDWCGNCERSGGQCWTSSVNNSTGCACKEDNLLDIKLDNKTCLPQTPPPRHQGTHLGLRIGVSAGIGGVLFLVVLLVCIRKKIRRNKNKNPADVKAFLESYKCLALNSYTYLDIKKVTNSFKENLGQGGYGHVFKGKLCDGRLVAVKVLTESKGDGQDFINEVATIGMTKHVNVVTLLGFCIEGTKRALVYEFMPNGSLERFIYTRKEQQIIPPLGWEKLYEIALGIARGLEYLHCGCNTRILHFDIKPQNILLDQDLSPKISDFGLAKLYPTRESIVSTVGARGTMGYIAPEFFYKSFGGVSHKSDVYSYGMMMLEMIGGRKNFDMTVENSSEIDFPFWIYNHFMQNENRKEKTIEVFENEKAKKMIIVALWCIQPHPIERPSMSKVVEMFEGDSHNLLMPPNPSRDPRFSYSVSF